MNCMHVQSGNPQEDRVLKHASVCNCLPSSIRQEAIEASKDSSLIAQIKAAHQDTNNSSLPPDEHSHTVPQKRKAQQMSLDIIPFRQAGKRKDEEA